MAHYWVANESPKLRAALAADWLDDLAEFHESIVAMACRDWRQTETRRPTPAEIRKLCLEVTRVYEPPPKPAPPENPQQIAARIAERQSIAPKFNDLAAMLRGEKPWPK